MIELACVNKRDTNAVFLLHWPNKKVLQRYLWDSHHIVLEELGVQDYTVTENRIFLLYKCALHDDYQYNVGSYT